jgi:DNA-binding LacI/PurR family transcriptional regulator
MEAHMKGFKDARRAVTIRQVAEQSGYSVSAVCLALSGKGRIGEDLVDRLRHISV